MQSLTKSLKEIYQSSQCNDLNDCEIAIEQARELLKTHGYAPQLVKRIVSLENKRKKLTNEI